MLEILQSVVARLQADAGVTALVKSSKISTGPVDITMEKQSELRYPSIVLTQVSEVSRSVPPVRDTSVQLDIFSRTSQMELEQIYEAVIAVLNYQSGDQGAAHIFWQRLGGSADNMETDRRFWHRAATFVFWSVKP